MIALLLGLLPAEESHADHDGGGLGAEGRAAGHDTRPGGREQVSRHGIYKDK